MKKGINNQSKKLAFSQNGIFIYSTICKLLKLNYLEMLEIVLTDQSEHVFCPDFQFKKKNLKVILFISVLSHSSISGGGEKVGRRKAVFHPGLKHALTSLVVLIYVTAPVAAVSGLLFHYKPVTQ